MTQRRNLTGTQRKYLRGLAHSLKPVVQVGKAGVNDAVIAAVSRALADHELVKVKIAAERDEREQLALQMEDACKAHLAGTIGTIAILYRPHDDPARQRIVLPVAAAAKQASRQAGQQAGQQAEQADQQVDEAD